MDTVLDRLLLNAPTVGQLVMVVVAPLLLLLLPLLHWRHWLLALCRTATRDAFYHLAGFRRPTATDAGADVLATFASVAAALPNKACFVADGEVWTFRLVAELVDALAAYLARRLPPGSRLGVFGVRASPLHAALWLGAAKAGCVAALMDAAGGGGSDDDDDGSRRRRRLRRLDAVVYEADAETSLLSALPLLRHLRLLLSCHGDPARPPRLPGALRLEAELLAAKSAREEEVPERPSAPTVGPQTPLLLVMEGGRQLAVTHARYLQLAAVPQRLMELGRQDVLYVCQPMHTALATVAGVGLAVTEGATCVLRGDCSPVGYWTDCARYGCTAGLYDRELAAELVRRPRRSSDRLHSVLTLIGCGMPAAASDWSALLERFKLAQIGELGACAAVPGAFLANTEGRPGCVGFAPLWLPRRARLRLLRVAPDTGLPLWPGVGAGPGDIALALVPAEAAEPADAWPNRLAGQFRPGDAFWHWPGLLAVGRDGDLKPVAGPDQRCFWEPGGHPAFAEMQSILSSLMPECTCTLSCIAAAQHPSDDGAVQAAGQATFQYPGEALPPDVLTESSSSSLQFPRRLRSGLEARLPSYARPRIVRVCGGGGGGGPPHQQQQLLYEVCPDTGAVLPLSDSEHRLLLKDLGRQWGLS